MQNRPISRRSDQVRDVRAGANATSGGSSDSELNDWQVKPIGDAGREVPEHVPHHLGVDDPRCLHQPAVSELWPARGTERPPARYRELGSSWPTACSVTRAAARTASRSSPVCTPDSSSM